VPLIRVAAIGEGSRTDVRFAYLRPKPKRLVRVQLWLRRPPRLDKEHKALTRDQTNQVLAFVSAGVATALHAYSDEIKRIDHHVAEILKAHVESFDQRLEEVNATLNELTAVIRELQEERASQPEETP
jgi:hypothetical protein